MSLELWGGPECTINRVGNVYYNQLKRTGHASRIDDLNLFAGLGIKTLRYPALWEATAPHGTPDWHWLDGRLARLNALGVEPIIGLLHHGSGPSHTSLVDPLFAEKFRSYAQSFARRYPWVRKYIPINEPLTTARFSGLYGLWYPHGHDEHTFLRAFLTQCRAIVLAMTAIREINPLAELIQTEDLGKTFSTPLLRYQADFENERRWLTFDLLAGRVDRHHPLWRYITRMGIPERELLWFLDNTCVPNVLGLNHYLTSERFLDDEIERYPVPLRGGNGRHRYADVEAVRVDFAGDLGPACRISEAWSRYRLPLALTEVHLGCTEDERVRWFCYVWRAAQNQIADGSIVKAVTAWSLLGAHNWNCLLTTDQNYYEPGVFDSRGSTPQPTALSHILRDLAHGRTPFHPALAEEGWWLKRERICYFPDVGARTPVFHAA